MCDEDWKGTLEGTEGLKNARFHVHVHDFSRDLDLDHGHGPLPRNANSGETRSTAMELLEASGSGLLVKGRASCY